MNHPESTLQAVLVKHLRHAGVFVFCVPNDACGSDARRAAFYAALGVLPGVADLCLLKDRREAFFLELKRPGGRQSPAQKTFAEKVDHYALADTLDGALAIVRGWGFTV